MRSVSSQRRQRGAVIITVCLMLLFLLGFMGFALDFSRAFVVKGELQTAMDSCALSAARELDGATDAITRAKSAGETASNLNRVNFQSATWSGEGQLTQAEITFRDQNYVVTTTPAQARYAQCQHVQPNVSMWLMHALGAFSGDTAQFPSSRNVMALAVATRASAQSSCPIPVGAHPKAGGVAPDYGFTVGEWVTLIMGAGTATNGEIGWANLDGSNSASETEAEMDGYCGVVTGDPVGTPGVQASIADAWNSRFGIYKATGSPSNTHQRPDYTGYAYTASNWPSQANAYQGATPAGAHATAANFKTKRLAYASCGDTSTNVRGANPNCEGITGLSLNSFTKLAAPGAAAGGHKQYGGSRRLVLVPVVDGSRRVVDFLCMLMLQPLQIPMAPTQLEYIGNGGAEGSPCTTSGLPGGTTGPLVPVLVR